MPAIGAAIAGIVGAVQTFAASSAIAGAFVRLAASVALSALARALQPKPDKPRQPGIRTTVTSTGGINPQSFILGLYATSGNEVAPPYSHGDAEKTPNAKLTYIHDLGDVVFSGLSRLIIDGNYATIGAGTHGTYGNEIEGRYQDYAWVTFFDGTQTTASSYLTGRYGARAKRPWLSDMIGRGVPYAVMTFRYNRRKFNALPRVRYEVEGLKLYDPRADTTVGGSGAQRWTDTATWAFSENPVVMIYNILRGITLPDGSVWGGECAADDLPLANWFAAMNVCDEAVALDGGGTETRYRAGYEVTVDEPPADVIEELLKACAGQISEFGGVYKMVAGGPAAPVYFITDDDIVVTDEQSFEPFPALEETYNAVHASYPDPEALWAAKDAPPRYSAVFETEDQERRLVANLTLPAVHHPLQAQRLMQGYIAEERRFRRHIVTLPPDAAALEPLDTISWTSTRNSYSAKLFEVASLVDHLQTLLQTVALRERDASDYDWDETADELPFDVSDPGVADPDAQAIADWAVTAHAIEDAAAADRRPALLLSWNGTDIDDVSGLRWEVRIAATSVLVAQGVTDDVAGGSLIVSEGILPEVEYEARAIFQSRSEREFTWTAWTSATTAALYVDNPDLADDAVTTPKIVDDNVTILATTSDAYHQSNSTSYELVDSLSFTAEAGDEVLCVVSARLDVGVANSTIVGGCEIRIRFNGTNIFQDTAFITGHVRGSGTPGEYGHFGKYDTRNWTEVAVAGTNTIEVHIRLNNENGTGNRAFSDELTIAAFLRKK